MNLPLILSEAPGNRDLLNLPLSHVWHATPGDVDGFSRAIAAWCDRLAQPAPINHRWIARTHFDAREKCGEVLALYGALLEARTIHRHPQPPEPARALRTGFPPR